MKNFLIKSKNSKRLHTPGCRFVRMMKKQNREFVPINKVGGGNLFLVKSVVLMNASHVLNR